MNVWLANHFVNPAFVAGGASLLALPIIIHLINRMRFRRVKFAAMEFLLQSQQRNRRRLLLEQLLLLLLRLLIIAAIVLLVSRLILDAAQLSMFRGAKAHHVVLLDDSGSMRERWGETSAFGEALTVVNQLLSEGAQRPDTQTFSLLLLSRPDQPFASQRDVNEALVLEMSAKLDPQTFRCTHQAFDLVAGLRAAKSYLAEEKATVQHLHVVSDFRERDWKDQKAVAAVVEELTAAGVTVNFVKTAAQAHPNLAVTELSGAVQVAAAGVPLRLRLGVTNYGDQAAKNVRVALADDGVRLPLAVSFDQIEPRTTAYHDFDVRLVTPAQHRLAASLEADALEGDNTRYLAVDVSPNVPTLIIDGSPGQTAGSYVADALAADPASTGIAPTIDAPEALRRRPLDDYRCLYLLNVPELPADAVDALERYVRAGGGLIWCLGDAVRAAHYNDALYREGQGVFPLPLAPAPRDLPADPTSTQADLVPGDHPVFAVLRGDDNPFLASVHVRRAFAPAEGWNRNDVERADGVRTLATLRNREPLIVERTLGAGTIVACLSTADPQWNDWARNPSYVVFQLDLFQATARRDRGLPVRLVGEPIQISLNPALYTENVEIAAPHADGERITRLQAAPEATPPAGTAAPAANGAVSLNAVFRDTDEPGVYAVRLLNQAQQAETRLIAYNAPEAESDLEVAATAALRKRLGNAPSIRIQEPAQFEWLQGEEAGAEVRQFLLWSLLALLLIEQWFAYRLSYHPPTRAASVPA